MGNAIVFIIVNLVAIVFAIFTVSNYRQLSRDLQREGYHSEETGDAMSIGFLEKIFQARAENADIRKRQKRVIVCACATMLALVISRHIFQFV